MEYISPLISIVAIIVSVISIFISNWLGRKNQDLSNQLAIKQEIYSNLYVPLLKQLHSSSFPVINYYWVIAVPRCLSGKPDPLERLMIEHFEKLPPKVAKQYFKYNQSTTQATKFYATESSMYDINLERFAKQASDLFDLILTDLLKEGSSLTQELGWPDISKTTLNAFHDQMTRHNGTRHIAPQKHKQFLKSVTTEPTTVI